jgi:hypothetical protein
MQVKQALTLNTLENIKRKKKKQFYFLGLNKPVNHKFECFENLLHFPSFSNFIKKQSFTNLSLI